MVCSGVRKRWKWDRLELISRKSIYISQEVSLAPSRMLINRKLGQEGSRLNPGTSIQDTACGSYPKCLSQNQVMNTWAFENTGHSN